MVFCSDTSSRQSEGIIPFRKVFFDMDGLMVDTEPLHYEAYRRVLAACGADYSWEENTGYIGLACSVASANIAERHHLPMDGGELYNRKTAEYRRMLTHGIGANPGLNRLLEYLQENGTMMAIVSMSPAEEISLVVEALGIASFFDDFISGDQVRQGKPAPDIYLLAARRGGVEPRGCLVLEDSLPGVEAADRAGMTCYAVPGNGIPPEKFLRAEGVFSSLKEVLLHLRTRV